MRNITFLLFSQILFCLICAGQRTDKYSEPFPNGLEQSGEAKYSYYVDEKSGKKIKHGGFRYSLRYSGNYERLTQSISGNYKKGSKDGNWSFRTSFNNYAEGNAEKFLTGSVTLNGGFREGIPHGKWVYKKNIKTRKKESIVNGRIKWSDYSPALNITIILNFRNGTLTDSLFISRNDNFRIEGVLNDAGYFNGDWLFFESIEEETRTYKKGLLLKTEKTGLISYKTIETKDFSGKYIPQHKKYSEALSASPEKAAELEFKPDTFYALRHKDYRITAYLLKEIFNNKYLLFNYLPGDNYRFSTLKGLKYFTMVNHVTPLQNEKLMKIKVLNKELENTENMAKRFKGKPGFSEEKEDLLKNISYNAKIGEKFRCMANSIVNYQEIQKAQQAAAASCKNKGRFMGEIPEFKSRNKALDYFLTEMNKLKSQSDRYFEGIKN